MGAQTDYPGETVSPVNVPIALLSDFLLVRGCLGPLWLCYAVRSPEHGVYAYWSHCCRRCNRVGASCRTENIITKRLAYQHSVYDSTALQCRWLASLRRMTNADLILDSRRRLRHQRSEVSWLV